MKRLFFSLIILFLSFTFSVLADKTFNLKILATTDIHGNMLNYNYYQDKIDNNIGLNRLSNLVQELRKNNNNVVLLDNGDLLQGNPLADYVVANINLKTTKHPIIKVMEYMGYDAINLGNHEFNYGLDVQNDIISNSQIPFISANVYNATDNKPRYTQHLILNKELKNNKGEVSNLKIGITGVLPPQIMFWDREKLEGKIIVNDIVSEVKKAVIELKKQGADIVIILSHSGITSNPYKKGMESAVVEMSSIKDVDFIITGHDHGEFPNIKNPNYPDNKAINNEKGTINNIPTLMPSSFGKYLGMFDITLNYNNNSWKIVTTKVSLLSSDKVDTNINDILASEQKNIIKYMNQEIGTVEDSPTDVKGIGAVDKQIANYFALVQDDFSVELVNKAQIDYIKNVYLKENPKYNKLPVLSAMAIFKNGGRGGSNDYTVINKGGFSIRSASDLYLYPNTLVILKINGKELREWLEWSSQMFLTVDSNSKQEENLFNPDFRPYNFDIIDGVTYKIDATKPARYNIGNIVNKNFYRVEDLKYQGMDVKDSDVFLVATNNYRANTSNIINNNNKNLVLDTAIENRSVVINYIKKQNNIINSVDDNWSLFVGSGNSAYFLSSIKGQDSLKNTSNKKITFVKDAGNGFGLYRYSN